MSYGVKKQQSAYHQKIASSIVTFPPLAIPFYTKNGFVLRSIPMVVAGP